MDTYMQAGERENANAEIIGEKRREKALREFKEVLEDLVFMLRRATGMQTVYLYWVNRQREQFVLETKSTELENVMFRDRLPFEEHFLDAHRDIGEARALKVGEEVKPEQLSHYYEEVPARHVTLLPFINNGETVAITVLESDYDILSADNGEVVEAYVNALRNVLNTYLEISDLYESEQEWVEYEERLRVIGSRGHRSQLLANVVNEIQQFLNEGGVTFVGKAMGGWCSLLSSRDVRHGPPAGMPLEQRTLGYEALENGKPEFAIHFNNNPKRLSPRERATEGATLAVPMLIEDRRQGLFLVYDQNPLVFKESTKHKIVNLVRLAALKMNANLDSPDPDRSIFANEYGGVLPDLWEIVVDQELEKLREGENRFHSWFGLLTLAELSRLRTRLRLEELNMMQKSLVAACNPSRFGFPGFIGSHADHVYAFLIQSRNEDAFGQWTGAVKKELSDGIELSGGRKISSGIQVGYTRLKSSYEDSYQVLSNAKSALAEAVKSEK